MEAPYLVSFEVVLGDTIPVHPHDIPIDVDHGVADDVAGAVAISGAPAKHVKAALEEEAPHADREALPVDHGVPVQNLAGLEDTIHTTERGVPSVARFCYVFPCELRGPAWAVGSYSNSQSARGTSQNIIFKTLRRIGCPAL